MKTNIFLTITILGFVIGVTSITYIISGHKKVSSEDAPVDCLREECNINEEK